MNRPNQPDPIHKIERFSFLFLVAGFLCFGMAFGLLGLWPAFMVQGENKGDGLPENIPEEFQVHYANLSDYHAALKLGRDIYVKEACWHCHSQYVRPVSNEALFYGPVSVSKEYENILNRPQLFGTRRVGPDLVREAGKHTNDWHYAHLYSPRAVVPGSVMPSYTWYFDESTSPPTPKPEAHALVAYLQYLGSWAKDSYKGGDDLNEVTMPPEPGAGE